MVVSPKSLKHQQYHTPSPRLLTEIRCASPTAAHVSSDPNGRCHPFHPGFFERKTSCYQWYRWVFLGDNNTSTNKLGLRTKTTGRLLFLWCNQKKKTRTQYFKLSFQYIWRFFFLGEAFQARKSQQSLQGLELEGNIIKTALDGMYRKT